MDKYDPKSLPPIDAVDIVDIRRVGANRVTNYMQMAANAPSTRCDGDTAQEFANAWRALSPGEPARCHVPPIGIRFRIGDTCYLEASLCWRCNNLFGLLDGIGISYAFDSASAPAQRLFALVQEIIGPQTLGDG